LVSEAACSEANGTTVEIEQIHVRSLDQPGSIRYIERHLAKWPKNCTVFVNNHECEYSEPPIREQRRFRPTGLARELLGDVELVLKTCLLSRICGLIPVQEGVPTCDKGLFP
jgi:hypothetical protein